MTSDDNCARRHTAFEFQTGHCDRAAEPAQGNNYCWDHESYQLALVGCGHVSGPAYAAYYNQARTHLASQKDAPLHRAVQWPGVIVAIPILAGLHHQYVRI